MTDPVVPPYDWANDGAPWRDYETPLARQVADAETTPCLVIAGLTLAAALGYLTGRRR